MSKGAYTYEPGNITEFGKDRMRFELGDTMVEGLADTTRRYKQQSTHTRKSGSEQS